MSELKYGFVPGRSKAQAVALLEAARAAKIDETLIKTRTGGYDVPEKVLDKYEAKLKESTKAEEEAKAPNETLAPGTAERVIADAEAADKAARKAAKEAADAEEAERTEQAAQLEREQAEAAEKAAKDAAEAEAEKQKQADATAAADKKAAPKTSAKGEGK